MRIYYIYMIFLGPETCAIQSFMMSLRHHSGFSAIQIIHWIETSSGELGWWCWWWIGIWLESECTNYHPLRKTEYEQSQNNQMIVKGLERVSLVQLLQNWGVLALVWSGNCSWIKQMLVSIYLIWDLNSKRLNRSQKHRMFCNAESLSLKT